LIPEDYASYYSNFSLKFTYQFFISSISSPHYAQVHSLLNHKKEIQVINSVQLVFRLLLLIFSI
ncbi:MAG TPA: hypothetical protein P5105_03650, partial [Victivallales bacterium]|nr:hypothetical protein [Victivallales bacterium]